MAGGHPENTVLMQGFAASNFYKSLQRAFPGKLWLFFSRFQKYCRLEEEGSSPL